MELKPEPEMRATYDPEAQLLWQKLVWNDRFADPVADPVVLVGSGLITRIRVLKHCIQIKSSIYNLHTDNI